MRPAPAPKPGGDLVTASKGGGELFFSRRALRLFGLAVFALDDFARLGVLLEEGLAGRRVFTVGVEVHKKPTSAAYVAVGGGRLGFGQAIRDGEGDGVQGDITTGDLAVVAGDRGFGFVGVVEDPGDRSSPKKSKLEDPVGV